MIAGKRRLLSEVVAGKIKRLIIERGLRAGDRLPTEHEMAGRFGVSRISVREATKALSFLGIIRGAPGRGLSVGAVDLERTTEFLDFHLALNHYPKVQLLDARMVIETGVLPYAMVRLREDPGIYRRLMDLARQMARTADLNRRIEEDCTFHRALVEASGIEPLAVFNDLIQVFFNRFRMSLAAGEWRSGMKDHRMILEALRAGDLDEAHEVLKTHIDYHHQRL